MATVHDFYRCDAPAEDLGPDDLVGAKVAEWLSGHDSVAEALDDLAANSDHAPSGRHTLFSSSLAAVLLADEGSFEREARRYRDDLLAALAAHLRPSAETQVERDLADAAEARGDAAVWAREDAA